MGLLFNCLAGASLYTHYVIQSQAGGCYLITPVIWHVVAPVV